MPPFGGIPTRTCSRFAIWARRMEPSWPSGPPTPYHLETTSASDSISSDSMSDVIEPTDLDESAGELRLTLFGRTDVGQVREHNEDNFLVANLATEVRGLKEENRTPVVRGNGLVIGVCDGMGGAAAGEVASQLAVDIIYEQLAGGGPTETDDELARRLVRAIEQA